jgi:hypothetical protein
MSKKKRSEFNKIVVMEKLLALMTTTRSRRLSSLSPQQRRRSEAEQILRNADASERELREAARLLTGREEIADAVEQIEIYRRYGMTERIQSVRATFSPAVNTRINRLSAVAPRASEALLDRISGSAPSKRVGRTRAPGFVDRLLSYDDIEENEIVRLDDCRELFLLFYELICGRAIDRFDCELAGTRDPTAAFG